MAYMAKALGIPARQVGTPCWNQPLGGVDYSGLARDNPNVTICWHGGIGSPDGTIGGNYLVRFPADLRRTRWSSILDTSSLLSVVYYGYTYFDDF